MSEHMKEKDEYSLKWVKDGEHPSKHQWVFIGCKQSQDPGEAQQGQEDEGWLDDWPK